MSEPKKLAVGLNKGFGTQKKEKVLRPSYRKGTLSKRNQMIRGLMKEVAGFAPYERRIMELLKVGKDKRALRVAKTRLGSYQRAKKKREFLQDALRQMHV